MCTLTPLVIGLYQKIVIRAELLRSIYTLFLLNLLNIAYEIKYIALFIVRKTMLDTVSLAKHSIARKAIQCAPRVKGVNRKPTKKQ